MDKPTKLVMLAIGLSAVTILGALAFEHIGGYLPCKLCLEQRVPYYIGLWTLAVALLPLANGGRSRAFLFCILTAMVFAKGAYLGLYQAGAEWRWWEGPTDCAAAGLSGHFDAADLLEKIRQTKLVSCTDPALRILGLSLAGWNFLISGAVAALAGAAAVANYRLCKDSEWPKRIARRILPSRPKD